MNTAEANTLADFIDGLQHDPRRHEPGRRVWPPNPAGSGVTSRRRSFSFNMSVVERHYADPNTTPGDCHTAGCIAGAWRAMTDTAPSDGGADEDAAHALDLDDLETEILFYPPAYCLGRRSLIDVTPQEAARALRKAVRQVEADGTFDETIWKRGQE